MDIQLLAALVIGIAVIVVLILRTRLDAFSALLIASVVVGAVAGSSMSNTIASITKGFGNTLGSIGIVIGLGVAVGKILEVSGAADALAKSFLKVFGHGREPWAMAATGSMVSIPVFCDSGFVIMNPLARSVARAKQGAYVTLALALGCGMTLTHHMVPPTPGPLAVAGILGADLGMVILVGLLIAAVLLPVVVLYAKWMGAKLENSINAETRAEVFHETSDTSQGIPTTRKPLGAVVSSVPLLLPLALIVLNTVASAMDKADQGMLAGGKDYVPSDFAAMMGFIGHPAVALMIGLVIAVYVLLPAATPQKQVHKWLTEAAASCGLILLITGAGGSLGQVLRDSGVGDALAQAIAKIDWLPAVLVPFAVATLVRIAQGSGTVAMITAASVTAPLVTSLGLSPLAATMACCAGSMVFSYFNDSYFWVVTRFTGLDGTAALKGWSGITTAVWLASLPIVIILGAVL